MPRWDNRHWAVCPGPRANIHLGAAHGCSKNKKSNAFIQDKQLKINKPQYVVFEWIPYNQFSNIKEEENGFATAIWNDGLLEYNKDSKKYERRLNEKVLKYLYNSQNIDTEFLNEVWNSLFNLNFLIHY